MPARYIPALRFGFLTAVYDPVIQRLLPERQLKTQLVDQAAIEDGMRILDIGTGTATLALTIQQSYPRAELIGLDGDPQILAKARAKVRERGLNVRLDEGLADELPYEDASFDRVVSSLMLHHLDRAAKGRTFSEVKRVLKPGGQLHVLDFGRPRTFTARLIALLFRHLERTADNIDGLIPKMLLEAGFSDVAETGHTMTLVGTLSLYRANKYGEGSERPATYPDEKVM